MAKDWVIRGAVAVRSEGTDHLDVRVEGGRIAQVGEGVSGNGGEEIAADGKVLLPGLIDDQVHFREPGLTHKACIATESAAAVAGGVTSTLEMPNTNPPTVDAEALEDKYRRAERDSTANYGFYMGATGQNDEAVRAAREAGACGVKVFLGASTGNLLVEEQEALERVFAAVPEGMVLAAHCEDAARIREREAEILASGSGHDMSVHPVIRDAKACRDSTERAIDLAKRNGTRLHVLHISTGTELDLFDAGDLEVKQVTAEACVHHLWFTDEDYGRLQGRIKCNPAIKSGEDRDALRKALTGGQIDVVATDHAPHLLEEKEGGYKEVAAGLPLVGHSMLVLLDLVKEGVIGLPDVARLGAENPARLFGIKDRGWIREGMHADLVLVDPEGVTEASDADVRYRCGWTPFVGHRFGARIEKVWVSGELAYSDGEVDDRVRGRRLEYLA